MNNSCWWVILLLLCCGNGCGNGTNSLFGNGGCGNNNSCWWIILLLLCCGGCGCNGSSAQNDDCGCGCGVDRGIGCGCWQNQLSGRSPLFCLGFFKNFFESHIFLFGIFTWILFFEFDNKFFFVNFMNNIKRKKCWFNIYIYN